VEQADMSSDILDRNHDSIRIKRLSHVALGARDLDRQADFYVNGCGLQVVEREARHLYFRAADNHHHVLELMGDGRGLHHVAFEVVDDQELDRSAKVLREYGIRIDWGPDREMEPGLGRLLRFRDPEGNTIELVSNVKAASDANTGAPGKPLSLNHLILYAGDLAKQQDFFVKVLGMRVTDTVPGLMTFLRCNANHHSFGFIALPRRGLQHAAFDVTSRAELSEVIVRLGDMGTRRIDGPGRHGPGNMLFTYFEDPEKNLLEWVTEIQQIDEGTHQARAWDAKSALNLWDTPERMGPPRGLRWLLPVLPAVSKLLRRNVR
jgi:catechol 2,3-dioxygenase-like lactoylglutathione lyase family enzyme